MYQPLAMGYGVEIYNRSDETGKMELNIPVFTNRLSDATAEYEIEVSEVYRQQLRQESFTGTDFMPDSFNLNC